MHDARREWADGAACGRVRIGAPVSGDEADPSRENDCKTACRRNQNSATRDESTRRKNSPCLPPLPKGEGGRGGGGEGGGGKRGGQKPGRALRNGWGPRRP